MEKIKFKWASGNSSQSFGLLDLGFAEIPITVDKRLRYAQTKLPSATSFIRKTLDEMLTTGRRFKKTIIKLKEVEKCK